MRLNAPVRPWPCANWPSCCSIRTCAKSTHGARGPKAARPWAQAPGNWVYSRSKGPGPCGRQGRRRRHASGHNGAPPPPAAAAAALAASTNGQPAAAAGTAPTATAPPAATGRCSCGGGGIAGSVHTHDQLAATPGPQGPAAVGVSGSGPVAVAPRQRLTAGAWSSYCT